MLESKKTTIGVVHCGMGNIGSIISALDFHMAKYVIITSDMKATECDAYILPGVGSFRQGIENLKISHLSELLTKEVLIKKKPFFGICLGMQLLFETSEEPAITPGLAWIKGKVVALQKKDKFTVPHVGWNDISLAHSSPILNDIKNSENFYFDHSYHVLCDQEIVTATCQYGTDIVAAIEKDNIFACQFHPEKSQKNGLKMIGNFLKKTEELLA